MTWNNIPKKFLGTILRARERVTALLFARAREKESELAHEPREAHENRGRSTVSMKQIFSEETPAKPLRNRFQSSSKVETEEPEMDGHARASKGETEWWIKVSGKKHDGTKIHRNVKIDSYEKPEIEMYRYENGRKIRALVIVGIEREEKH